MGLTYTTEPKKRPSTYTLHVDSNGEFGGTLNLNGAEIPLRPQEVINLLYKLGNARQVEEVEPGLFRYFY